MNTVIIDNYDSFTYNLSHIVRELGDDVTVLKNDAFEINDLYKFDKIIFSPGPGVPEEAGLMKDVIRYFMSIKPMLGVCLGEQAIGEVFGAKLSNLDKVYHGIQSDVTITDHTNIFNGLPPVIKVGRYHSWVVDKKTLTNELVVMAESQEGYIMALRHKKFPIYGIQFHPESILTPDGKRIVSNFLSLK